MAKARDNWGSRPGIDYRVYYILFYTRFERKKSLKRYLGWAFYPA